MRDPVTGGLDAGLVGPQPILGVNFLLLLACLLAFAHSVRTYIHMVRPGSLRRRPVPSALSRCCALACRYLDHLKRFLWAVCVCQSWPAA